MSYITYLLGEIGVYRDFKEFSKLINHFEMIV